MRNTKLVLIVLGVLVCSSAAFAQSELSGIVRDELALGLTPPVKSIGMVGAYLAVDGEQSMHAGLVRVFPGIQPREIEATGVRSEDRGRPPICLGNVDSLE